MMEIIFSKTYIQFSLLDGFQKEYKDKFIVTFLQDRSAMDTILDASLTGLVMFQFYLFTNMSRHFNIFI